MKRRGRLGPPRLLILDKPTGPTSFAAVRKVRAISAYRRVGHAGTLDPFASGVLVLGLGSATRLLRYAMGSSKVYRMRVRFGRATDSHDPTGETTFEAPVRFSEAELRAALPGFAGDILQRPPRLSAIHVNGERAYRLYRSGAAEVKLAERPVHVSKLELVSFEPSSAVLRVECSSGTYMRALARDLGEQLDCPAHAEELVRESVGSFGLEEAHALDELDVDDCYARTVAPIRLFEGENFVRLSADEVRLVRQGEQPRAEWIERVQDTERMVLVDPESALVAVAELREGSWRLSVVLPEAVDEGS